MNLTIYLESLGCSKNLVDAEFMLGILNKHGYKLTNNDDKADVIILNTCGFIESAKQESINKIIELGKLKENRLKLLVVSGCLAERYHEELVREIPEVDAVVGTGNYNEIINIINDGLADYSKKIVKVGNVDSLYDESLPRYQTTPSHMAYVKIADGCDNHCTYCIIPKLRGKYRSRRIEYIEKEVQQLAQQGVKEIILIAQDTTQYGIDLYNDYKLYELLNVLSKIEGIEWIRLLYSYPERITDKLIDVLANNPKVCKYLDLPIQHCSDEILKKMNRRTSKQDLANLMKKLKNEVPGITLRTTLIVGFPGEEEKHFEELVDFVETTKFDKLGVFTYSQEEDTPAAKLPNQIDEEVKQERQRIIMEKQQVISLEKNNEKIGMVLDVLVEERFNDNNEYLGRSMGDAPEIDGLVYITAKDELKIGGIYKVYITQALEYDLMGEVVDEFSK